MAKNEYELILAIVNKGCTDLVMNAASKAGARGGTITPARGTANSELTKFYGISVSPEKEAVFIVVPFAIRDQVMKQIYDEAGIETRGQGIIISLPITDAVGLVSTDETAEEKKKEINE